MAGRERSRQTPAPMLDQAHHAGEDGSAASGAVSRYRRIERKIAADRCVILDGATGTELFDARGMRPEADDRMWGLSAVIEAPSEVQAVHGRYVEAGCDIVCTNTWGLPSALREGNAGRWDAGRPVHWMDSARGAIQLARSAVGERETAVAFSINGDVDTPESAETIRLLARAFEREPPDLILLETLSLVRSCTYATVQALMRTGLPVWLSFRRCRHGVCGVYGEHWGGPEGDAFGRACRRFEEIGIGALLINCIPPDHVPGMVSWLRDFTDLPLGVYPNLGYLSGAGWRHAGDVCGEDYAAMARSWREEGAQIIGGCCGVGPQHIEAAVAALAGTAPGQWRPQEPPHPSRQAAGTVTSASSWRDRRGRALFPLDFPDLVLDEGVFAPTQGSFLAWQHIFNERIGAQQRCLDIGCGCGLLAVQLARNDAAHVHAIDLDPRAVRNTLTNAFRNGVADRLSAAATDLYPWVPDERYDVIVASLFQMPVDPFEQVATHRPLDYWGRNLIDHLIRLLPSALADDGTAYIMQLSIIGQHRTMQLLESLGYQSRAASFSFFELAGLFKERHDQIARVEQQSDAYHLRIGGEQVMVAYMIEVTRQESAAVSR
ncbi:MAG: homocysteine S-methyltransferase family protein [Solirubrobacteraceae bacterium]